MSNYDLLKQKIQETIPSLKEFINGCIIETPHWNTFRQKFEDDVFDEYYVFNGKVYSDDNEIFCKVSEIESDFNLPKCRFGREPMLNDVLNYWSKKTSIVTATGFKNQLHYIYSEWDLSKPYLKDQSEELIAWLLELS